MSSALQLLGWTIAAVVTIVGACVWLALALDEMRATVIKTLGEHAVIRSLFQTFGLPDPWSVDS